MSTEEYIEWVYKNLKGELNLDEFKQLNEQTAANVELASVRIEIEDAWDVSGSEQLIVNKKDTETLFQKIVESKSKGASIFSLRNIISGIAAMFILTLGSLWLMRDQTEIYTKEGLIRLADNSKIELRKGSRLEVKSFFKDIRKVKLNGEAFFNIEKDPNRPFIISTALTEVEVLGTSFLVKESGSSVFVVVEEGSVQFSSIKSSESIQLTAGMKAEYSSDKGLNAVQYQNLAGWKNGLYQYKDLKLEDVLNELAIIFNSSIYVENKQLLNCRISAILTVDNLDDILKQLSEQLEMNAKKNGQDWILSGGKCQ